MPAMATPFLTGPKRMWLLAQGFLGTRLGLAALGIIAGLGWMHVHDMKIKSRVVAQITERNAANVKKADTARRSIEQLPVDRLFDAYRRD